MNSQTKNPAAEFNVDESPSSTGPDAADSLLTVMLVAGEPSGDVLGGGLMQALKSLWPGDVKFIGVGGEQMKGQGLDSLFPIDDLAVLGLAQVGPRIPKFLALISQVVQLALETQPDCVVLIDSSGFTDRVAARLKKRGIKCPVIKYVAPQVWASRPWRVNIVKRFYDHILTLYPFEPPYFTDVGLDATFVGHPLTDKDISMYDPSLFCERHGIMNRSSLLCMLPGSRLTEIKFLLPVFRKTVEAIQEQVEHLQLVVPTTPNVHDLVTAEVKKWPIRTIIVNSDVEKYMAFRASRAALAASGTVSLELAMCGTPCVIAYKIGWLTATVFRPLIKTPFLSLINISEGEAIIPEFVQENCHPQLIAQELVKLLTDDALNRERRTQLLEAFGRLRFEGKPPSIQAAETVLQLTRQSKVNAAESETPQIDNDQVSKESTASSVVSESQQSSL